MTEDIESNAQQIYEASERRRCYLYPRTLGYVSWEGAPEGVKREYRKVAAKVASLKDTLEYLNRREPTQ